MRLLIADDEQELVRAIAAILRFYDYQIDTASNGLQALELLQQYSYDGAVLDIMMPGLSGLQVLEQMRQQKRQSSRQPRIIQQLALSRWWRFQEKN